MPPITPRPDAAFRSAVARLVAAECAHVGSVAEFARMCGLPRTTLDSVIQGSSALAYTLALIDRGMRRPVGWTAFQAWAAAETISDNSAEISDAT